MDRLSSLLPKVLNKRGLGEQAAAAQICWLANEWLQEHLPDASAMLKAVKYSEGTLYIESEHSVASQECQSISADLQEYLQAHCPSARIENIRIIREK